LPLDRNGRAHLVDAEIARLRSFAPFDRLPRALLERVVLSARLIFHRAGETVCHPAAAEDRRGIWIVRSGSVCASARLDDSQERRGELLGAGAMFPLDAIVSGSAASPVYVAAEDAFIWRLDDPSIEALLGDAAFIGWLAARLQADNDPPGMANAEPARGRQASDRALPPPLSAVG